MTSFQVVARLKKLLNVKKIGHSGTLDKLASGLLLVAVGSQATKLLEFLIKRDKIYEVGAILGQVSDSYDLDGVLRVVDTGPGVPVNMLNDVLQSFVGDCRQKPPVYSALKINGKRASDRARAGEKVEIEERLVKIYEIGDLEYQAAHLKFKVSCSSGTYVRSLVHDLGQKLGCGAVMSSLRRSEIGEFGIGQALTLESLDSGQNLNDNFLDQCPAKISIAEMAQKLFKRIDLSREDFEEIKCGRKILDSYGQSDRMLAAFYDGGFVGILTQDNDNLKVYKNFV